MGIASGAGATGREPADSTSSAERRTLTRRPRPGARAVATSRRGERPLDEPSLTMTSYASFGGTACDRWQTRSSRSATPSHSTSDAAPASSAEQRSANMVILVGASERADLAGVL